MGLDQYAHAEKDGKKEEIFYWRKHADLQGFFAAKWMQGHPTRKPDDFNCVAIEVTQEMLDELYRQTMDGTLPRTVGFFFGRSSSHDALETMRFIGMAEQYIRNGYKVTYDSWW